MGLITIKKWLTFAMTGIFGMLIVISGLLYAAEPNEPQGFIPTNSTQINWFFSGLVSNENGENYNYSFQLERDDHHFHVTAALFDAQTQQVLIEEDSQTTIEDPTSFNWTIGHAFLRFNAINNSWIFGLKDEKKHGFNFKIDMLNSSEHEPVKQNLRQGIAFMVEKTGQLNGLIQLDDTKEQFVTAKNAWFRQIWLTKEQAENHQLNSILCHFADGSSFYSINMQETDALRGAIAGSYDAQGAPVAISQFVHAKQSKEGPWHIRITSPNLDLILKDPLQQNNMIAGFVTEKNKSGFCILSQNAMGKLIG